MRVYIHSVTNRQRHVLIWARTCAGCLLLAACVGAEITAAPPPPPPPAIVPRPYCVQVGDLLAIRLFLMPELNEDVTVRPDGRITTTLAQAIPAAGHTPEQIAGDLRAAYDVELKDPRITVGVKTYSPSRIYVAGEVPAPGEQTTTGPPLSLLQAIARAGGLRVTGDPDHVLIVRRGDDGRPAVYAARFADADSGRAPAADVTLQPFDVVIVPKTGVARVFRFWNQYVQQFVPVSWGFSYNVNPVVTTPHVP